MRGVHEAIRRELGAAAGGAGGVGDQAGRSIGDRMGAGLSRTLQASTRAAMAGLETVALAGGAAMSAALVKGWGRLTTIQDATAALTVSLQDSAAAGSLLDDVLGVVSGTPFNLDQFASAAQQMVGMGIEAEKVPGYLEAVGEAAATQGGRAEEMAGRLTTVMGQMAASGQVQLADVWRISDTGVNALGILANHFGVARDEMKDMISSGAVPAGEALDALADGILHGSDGPAGATVALAGTMDTLRESMSGAVGGIEPAMARLGAAIIEPFSPAVVAGANGLVDTIDRLAEVLGDLASRAAASGVVERLVGAIEDGPDVVDRLVDGLGDLDGVLAVVAGSMAGLAGKGLGGLLGTIGVAVPGIGPLAGAIGGLVLSSDEARDALGDLAGDLMPVLGEAATAVEPFLDAVSDAAGDLVPALADVLVALAGAAADVLEVAAPLAASLLDVAAPLIASGLQAIADLLTENEWLVQAAIAATITWATSSAWATLSTAAAGVAGQVTFLVSQVQAIAATRGISTLSAGMEVARASAGGLLAAINPVTLAIGAVAAAATVAWSAASKAARDAQADIEDLRPVDFDERNIRSVEQYASILNSAIGPAGDLARENDSWAAALRGTAEVLTPMENAVLNSFESYEQLEAAVRENDAVFQALRETYIGLYEELERPLPEGMTLSTDDSWFAEMDAWVEKLDLDPMTMSVEEMAEAIDTARLSAQHGTGQTEAMADAYERLNDPVSSATDQLEAWKDMLNEAIAAQIDTTLTADEWALSLPELTWQLAELGNNITGTSTEARESRLVLGDMAREALRMAETIAQTEGVDAGRWALESYRQDLIRTATEAGITEGDITALLEEFGLVAGAEPAVLEVTAETTQAQQALDRLKWTLAEMGLSGPDILRYQADAGRYIGRTRRWGGIDNYATGGVRDAMLGSGRGLVWWDEPATGGEAYVPRLGDKARSKQVLDVAAGWYGLDVVPQGARGDRSGPGGRGGVSRSITIENVNLTARSAGESEARLRMRLQRLARTV